MRSWLKASNDCNVCYTCYVADLNIRNVDSKLIARLKSDAALSGMTLREWCLQKLEGTAVAQGRERRPMPSKTGQTEVDGSSPSSGPSNISHGCKTCGALVGHQKWCKR
jgi:hypothetical protein